ncbi:hypothetical protein ACFQ1S_13355, partial [Kibdelosporangium lantanae]
MSFVRYDDYRAPERPDFQAELDTIIAAIVQRTKESPRHEPGGRAVRSAHAKTYGLLRASVPILQQSRHRHLSDVKLMDRGVLRLRVGNPNATGVLDGRG